MFLVDVKLDEWTWTWIHEEKKGSGGGRGLFESLVAVKAFKCLTILSRRLYRDWSKCGAQVAPGGAQT
jgi:hypothetical protein